MTTRREALQEAIATRVRTTRTAWGEKQFRERVAIAALQGILAGDKEISAGDAAHYAVVCADALINELQQ